jgi:hypothetical protein
VGSGTIAERAVDWDGYTGSIPRTSASIAKVLGAYGYKTSAFGKWHNTPATDTTAMGPFTLWPTGEVIGFDYFYGFLAGETSQWEPRLVENLNPVEPPHDEKYHLSEDLADQAITWMRKHRAYTPDQPFLMYWAPGPADGPCVNLDGFGLQALELEMLQMGLVKAVEVHGGWGSLCRNLVISVGRPLPGREVTFYERRHPFSPRSGSVQLA